MTVLRWSSIGAFMKCQRRYEYAYFRKLVRKGRPSRPLLLGSVVHAGLQGALVHSYTDPNATDRELVKAAILGTQLYRRQNQDMKAVDWKGERDENYFIAWMDVMKTAEQILSYQVPRIGLGKRWRVASTSDVFGAENAPMVEYNFHAMLDKDTELTGTIDAVMRDTETGELVLFDWKTRGAMPDERLVDMDGQLKFYAMALELMGSAPIRRVVQYQIKNTAPKPAELTEKKKQVSRGNISSTWEVWSASLIGLGYNPNDFLDMRDKLPHEREFTNPIETMLNDVIINRYTQNVLMIARAVRFAETNGEFPALQSIANCKYCEFAPVCSIGEAGGNVDFVMQTEYETGEAKVDDNDTLS